MVFWLASTALAQRPPSIRPELMTTVPLSVTVGILGEVGPSIRGGWSIGVLPRPYVTAINTYIGATNETYGPSEAQLVENSLRSSLVLRAYGG